MKKILLIVCFFLSTLTQAQVSSYQRIVLLPANLGVIEAGQLSQAVASFCYDLGKSAPSSYVDYTKVVYGGEKVITMGNASMTLQEALSKGLIKFVFEDGSYSSVKLKNLTNKPIKFTSKTRHVIGENSASNEGLTAKYINGKSQDEVWWGKSNYNFSDNYEKIKVYNKEGLINTMNPTNNQLSIADRKFKSINKIKSTNEFLDLLYTKYTAIVFEDDLKIKKIFIYQRENLLKNSSPTNLEIKQLDKVYSKKNNIDINILNDKINNIYNQITEEIYASEDLLYLVSNRNISGNLKVFEKELGLEITGNIEKSQATSTLSFYHNNWNILLQKNYKDPSQLIEDIKKIKSKFKLPILFNIDDESKVLTNKLSQKLDNIGLGNNYLDKYFEDKSIYFTNYDYVNYNYATYQLTFQNADFSLNKIAELKSDWSRVGIQKIKSDLYQVNGKLINIDNLIKEVSNMYYDDIGFNFGDKMTPQDIQGLIKTLGIKKGNFSTGQILLTSKNINMAKEPTVTYDDFYNEVVIKFSKPDDLKKGSGINANFTIKIKGIKKSFFDKIKSIISEVFGKMKENDGLEFSEEFLKELKVEKIEVKNEDFRNLATDIEIIYNFKKPKYDWRNQNYASFKMYSWLYFPNNTKRVFGNLATRR